MSPSEKCIPKKFPFNSLNCVSYHRAVSLFSISSLRRITALFFFTYLSCSFVRFSGQTGQIALLRATNCGENFPPQSMQTTLVLVIKPKCSRQSIEAHLSISLSISNSCLLCDKTSHCSIEIYFFRIGFFILPPNNLNVIILCCH